MDTMDFSVPEQYRDFVQARVAEGGYGTTNEYLQTLIEADRKRLAQAALDAELLKGIESGSAVPMTSDDWESIRSEVRNRIEARTKSVS